MYDTRSYCESEKGGPCKGRMEHKEELGRGNIV